MSLYVIPAQAHRSCTKPTPRSPRSPPPPPPARPAPRQSAAWPTAPARGRWPPRARRSSPAALPHTRVRQEVAPALVLQPDERVRGTRARTYVCPGGAAPRAFGDRSGDLPSTSLASAGWTAGPGWAGTVEALARWANRLFEGRILRQSSLDQMTECRTGRAVGRVRARRVALSRRARARGVAPRWRRARRDVLAAAAPALVLGVGAMNATSWRSRGTSPRPAQCR
jgi:hypothetical protein